MWLKNKKQGTVWEIVDPAEIKRKLADPNYEETKPPKVEKEKEKKEVPEEPL